MHLQPLHFCDDLAEARNWKTGKWLTYVAANNETLPHVAKRTGLPDSTVDGGWGKRDLCELNKARPGFNWLVASGKRATKLKARTILLMPWHSLKTIIVQDDEDPVFASCAASRRRCRGGAIFAIGTCATCAVEAEGGGAQIGAVLSGCAARKGVGREAARDDVAAAGAAAGAAAATAAAGTTAAAATSAPARPAGGGCRRRRASCGRHRLSDGRRRLRLRTALPRPLAPPRPRVLYAQLPLPRAAPGNCEPRLIQIEGRSSKEVKARWRDTHAERRRRRLRESASFDPRCTHLICVDLVRSEKPSPPSPPAGGSFVRNGSHARPRWAAGYPRRRLSCLRRARRRRGLWQGWRVDAVDGRATHAPDREGGRGQRAAQPRRVDLCALARRAAQAEREAAEVDHPGRRRARVGGGGAAASGGL